jgi:hypothetical protein
MIRWVGFLVVCYLASISYAVSPRMSAQTAPAAFSQSSASATDSHESLALDYEFFKTQVEPIFLKKRPTHARCYVCHDEANHALKLAKLSP